MDFFSHLAWTYLLLFRGRPDMVQGLFFGVFPDIIFVGLAIILSINLFARTRQISRQKLFPFVRRAYLVGHSLITVAVFCIIASIISGGFYFPALAWALHILFDIYTHKGSPAEPQMPLYPLQKPSIKGYIWWRNPYFMAANWLLILLVYFLASQ
ncbi:MAG: hypothetical protein V1835_00035 [Candidatus Micrarchaeota archaeon]